PDRANSRQPKSVARRSSRSDGSRRSLEHQLAHVFHRWAPVGNHLVVVFLEVKIVAKFLLLGSAKIEMFSRTDEIGGELRGSEPSAFPFRYRFAFLLKS